MKNNNLSALIEKSKSLNAVFLPKILHLKNKEELSFFNSLLEQPGIMVCDEILGQTEELVKSRNPKRVFKKDELREEAIKYLGNGPWEEFGCWVYYPWSNKIIHILPEMDFIDVRTNRNQYKITPAEREILSGKKIGVIGLSVGQSIALTIAMERICGEIRLADFDKVELSNLNRIRTGVHNLEISKVVAVAREISEIDPFLKVTCLIDGVTEENIDNFFIEGGKLDACVEVCDGLDIKILSRVKAKEYRVPVVMTSSDRGTTDVERYDLNPDLPILHGFIDHLDISKIKSAKTNEEKVPYLLPMLGLDTTSTRLKSSMIEIGQSITTWPQLASGVLIGGTVCTDVCRRIFLNQFHDSGRYFLDIEELISDKVFPSNNIEINKSIDNNPLSEEQMLAAAQHFLNKQPADPALEWIENEIVAELISAAIQAPSGANVQPWKWLYYSGKIFLFLDSERSSSLLDFRHMASYIGLGAATENLVLKAHEKGLKVDINSFPTPSSDILVSVFTLYRNSINLTFESNKLDYLVNYINQRITNRREGNQKKINIEVVQQMKSVVETVQGAQLFLAESREEIHQVAEIMASVDRIRLLDRRGHHDFVNEIRWSDIEVDEKKDGIDIKSLFLTPLEHAGFHVAKEWQVVQNVKEWNGGDSLEKYSKRIVNTSSAIGLITMPSYDRLSYYKGGRAVQRLWLTATQNNISIHPHTASIFLFSRMIEGNMEGLSDDIIYKLKNLREKFVRIFPDSINNKEIFLFRLSITDNVEISSVRRHVQDVFFTK